MPVIGFVVFGFLFYEAGHRTTAINIGILQGSVPIFVLIGAFLLYRTRITWLQISGVIVGFLGVVVVATGGLPGVMREIRLNAGDLMMIGACLVWASYTIGLKKRPAIPGLILFAVFCIPAAFVSAPFAIFELASGRAPWPTLTGCGVLLYTTVFPSFLAQLFFLRGVDLMGPGRTGMFVNLTPIFAALLAVGILREAFHVYHAVALVLILAGLWLSRDRSFV
jgi:drug/metabolite transporter (DMT)-like permease